MVRRFVTDGDRVVAVIEEDRDMSDPMQADENAPAPAPAPDPAPAPAPAPTPAVEDKPKIVPAGHRDYVAGQPVDDEELQKTEQEHAEKMAAGKAAAEKAKAKQQGSANE